jgi:hypothetical protein
MNSPKKAYKTTKALNVMAQSLAQNFKENKAVEIFSIMPGEHVKTAEEAGRLITDIILDGKNHNGEVINYNGAAMDYNYGLF